MRGKGGRTTGIGAALASALFLGLSPVFGKQAITLGFSPLAVVALRTGMAAGLLLLIMMIWRRSFLFIYPAGLLGCALAGVINGLGSVLYYLALGRLDVSIGQLLYSLYPLFLAIWLHLDRQPSSPLTTLRIALSAIGVILLTLAKPGGVDWLGVILMLGAAAMYAFHLPINQRVLYDIPAPTVTLYTLLAMSVVVIPVYFVFDAQWPVNNVPWWPVIGLTLVTFFSRLTLFMGVKHLGGMQTALLGLSELFIAILFSHLWLHEQLQWIQWIGAGALGVSLILIGFEKVNVEKRRIKGGWLSWLRPPEIPPEIPWGPHE